MGRDERIERQMDFIVNQQAQFSVDISLLQERMAQLEHNVARMENVVTRLANASLQRIEKLESAQLETEIKFKELAVAQTELAAAQAHADGRLSALIDIIIERNGGMPKS